MKLGTKTIILIILLIVPLFGISSSIMLYFHEISLRESVLSGADGIARASALTISAFIQDSRQNAEVIAANLPLESLQAGRMAEIEAYLNKISTMHRFGNGIFVLDREGNFLTDYPAHPELQGVSFAFREYYQRTVSEGHSVVSEPYLSKRTGAPVLTFTAPLLDSRKQIVAIVACSVDLLSPKALGGLRTQRIGTSGYQYVFDKSRLMILHPDNGRLLKRDIPEGKNRLLDEAVKGFEGVGETINTRGIPMLLGFRSVPHTSWIVGVQIPKSEAFASLYESRRIMIGTAGASLLFIIVAGFCAVQKITHPLHNLHSAAKIIMEELESPGLSRDGKVLTLLDSIRTRDEMGLLAGTFRELVERQRRSVSMLRKSAYEWELTFNAVNEAVLCLDRNGTILRINRIAGEWLRTSSADAAGMSAQLLVQGDAALESAWVAPESLDPEHSLVWNGCLPTREGMYEFAVSPINDGENISGILLVVRDVTERTRMENAIRQMAFNDALTGLPNRVLMMDRLEQVIFTCSRKKNRCGVLFLDLDRFKPVNDTYGHDTGDELLRQVARRLETSLRRNDTVARLGGDEFVVILQEIIDQEEITSVARKIIKNLGEPFEVFGNILHTGTSIGIAIFPEDGTVAQDLIAHADAAMYRVKREERGSFRMYQLEDGKC
jgi:diguanylate cyclase (GGDEF)-like protein/PAS domain S-box-containing protein